MEVTWPDNRCDDNPRHTHHFINIFGSVWRCKYCWRCKWLPRYLTEAIKFSISIHKYGIDTAYNYAIGKRLKIRETLEKLEDIRLLRKSGLPEKAVLEAMAGIVTPDDRKPTPEDIAMSEHSSIY